MDRVQSMFGNHFNSLAGSAVERATSPQLHTEDWALNIEVCDIINSYPDGPKDAFKALKKRLSGGNKHVNQVLLSLSLIDACVKNCGIQFHMLVTTKEFCNDVLLKTLQPKYNPPLILQDKVLAMIRQYAETFGNSPATAGVGHVYANLKERGYEFPEVSPLKGELVKPNAKAPKQKEKRSGSNSQHRTREAHSLGARSQVINPTPEQIAKLHNDLKIVTGNINVFSEMLTELNPLSCDPADLELMHELNRTCRAMQQRTVELIGQIGNEEVTIDLLRVNDDLNNIFLRYERFERYRSNKEPSSGVASSHSPHLTSGSQPSSNPHYISTPVASLRVMEEPPPSYSDTEQPTPEVNDLIDFTADSSTAAAPPSSSANSDFLSNDLSGLNLGPGPATSSTHRQLSMSEQLDAFADEPDKEMLELGESEKEIEQWLKTDGGALGFDQLNSPTQNDNVTDEFSAFLNERAVATPQASSGQTLPYPSNH